MTVPEFTSTGPVSTSKIDTTGLRPSATLPQTASLPSLNLLTTAAQAWNSLAALSVDSKGSFEIDGRKLTISQVVAAARQSAYPSLAFERDPQLRAELEASVACIEDKLARGQSLYGINTGFGATASTRTSKVEALQLALLQHQQCGLLSLPHGDKMTDPHNVPLSIFQEPLSMPDAWVKAAMVVRLNSLSRGHSAIRPEVLRLMCDVVKSDIVPQVPVRSSISASGDLSPLSYVAGCLAGQDGIQTSIKGHHGIRQKVPASIALAQHGLKPVTLRAKEGLAILNGTSFSAVVGALALHEIVQLSCLTHVTSAMGIEATLGTDASFAEAIHNARPHPGQLESAAVLGALLKDSHLAQHWKEEEHFLGEDDADVLRQDNYAFRTAAQFMGPSLEELTSAWKSLEIELNSTTDNPVVSVADDHVHHGGNFQAMAPGVCMEKARLALAHLGKITFAQLTLLINPSSNRGLSANLSATDPSLNFHCKGIDIALASVTSELQWLASPVSVHIQSAESHNQSVNSLALLSARYTLQAVDCMQQLLSWSLYVLCHALDMRALQRSFAIDLAEHIHQSITKHFSTWITPSDQSDLSTRVFKKLKRRMDETAAKDFQTRLLEGYMVAGFEIHKYFASLPSGGGADPLRGIMAWREESVKDTWSLHRRLTLDFLQRPNDCHAVDLIGACKPIYTYIRRDLGIGMHGLDNYFDFGLDKPLEGQENGGDFLKTATIGENVSKILDKVRSGEMYAVMQGVLGRVLDENTKLSAFGESSVGGGANKGTTGMKVGK